MIEAKTSKPDVPPALGYFAKALGVETAMMVVRDLDSPGRAGTTPILDAANFLSALPV